MSSRIPIPEIQERNYSFLKDITRELKRQRRIELFWDVVHNTGKLIVFLVVLPVLPLIRVIQAIRGELEC